MSRARRLLAIAGVVLLALAAAAALAIRSGAHERFARRAIERALNRRAEPFLRGSLRVGSATLGPGLRVRLDDVRGDWHGGGRVVPFRIARLETQTPLLAWLRGKPLSLRVADLHLYDVRPPGIDGLIVITHDPAWRVELQASIQHLGLNELEWLSPSYLQGSTGDVAGTVTLRAGALEDPWLSASLRLEEPGGLVQGRLFDLLRPYVPAARLEPLGEARTLVAVRDARIGLQLPATDRLKMVLHVAVPEYNLDLNMTIEILVDERDILRQLMRVIGILHPEAP